MTTRICSTKADCQAVLELMLNMKLPITVNIKKGKDRSVEQNRLQRMWLREAAEQLQDETIEQKRGYCKLHFGVPIMRKADADFCHAWNVSFLMLTYETKLELMGPCALFGPDGFPVTRLFDRAQGIAYTDKIAAEWSERGVVFDDLLGGSDAQS